MKKNLGLVLATAIAAFCGCYTGPDVGAAPGQAANPTPSDPAAAGHGLPCDVAELLTKNCVSCHSDPPRKGAKSALVSRALLAGPWEGSASLAQACVDRMKDAAAPMPTAGLLPAAQVDILTQWIAQGMPEGSCADPSAETAPPINLHCTSGTFWTKATTTARSS